MEKDLRGICKIVRQVLEEDVRSRSSDRRLYILCCQKLAPNLVNKPFSSVFENKLFPSTETVRRSRQLLQNKFEHLRSDPDVEAARLLEEDRVKEFVVKNGE